MNEIAVFQDQPNANAVIKLPVPWFEKKDNKYFLTPISINDDAINKLLKELKRVEKHEFTSKIMYKGKELGTWNWGFEAEVKADGSISVKPTEVKFVP